MLLSPCFTVTLGAPLKGTDPATRIVSAAPAIMYDDSVQVAHRSRCQNTLSRSSLSTKGSTSV